MTVPESALSTSIETAKPADLDEVTETLADAFLDGDFGPWLIPDRAARAAVYRPYFRIFAEFWLNSGVGIVETTLDRQAVALWWPVEDSLHLDIADYDARLAAVTGPACPRFAALDQVMHEHHPLDRPHHYLAFLAVRPAAQGRGLGAALLGHHHRGLDAEGGSAYLEATGARNSELYERHGYVARPLLPVADGPALIPMWRAPA